MQITFSLSAGSITTFKDGESSITTEHSELLKLISTAIKKGEITLLDLKNLMLPVIIDCDGISLEQELPISQFTELTNAYFNYRG